METLKKQVSLIKNIEKKLVEEKLNLDKLLLEKVIEVNNFTDEIEFEYNGKTITGLKCVNMQIKGTYLKKDGEVAKNNVAIKINENLEIIF